MDSLYQLNACLHPVSLDQGDLLEPVRHPERSRPDHREACVVRRSSNKCQIPVPAINHLHKVCMRTECKIKVVAYTVTLYNTGYDGTKEKQRLQNLMTYGSELEPIPANVLSQPAEKAEEVDRFDEGILLFIHTYIESLVEIQVTICNCVLVVEEIEERRLFLSEMEALGQGKEHRNKIMTEISQVML